MNRLPLVLAPLLATLFASHAQAVSLPELDVTCPTDLAVRSQAGGPVFINGKQATLSKFSEQYYEAKGEGVTISISFEADGTPSVTYTGRHGANGVCSKREESPEQAPAAEQATPQG